MYISNFKTTPQPPRYTFGTEFGLGLGQVVRLLVRTYKLIGRINWNSGSYSIAAVSSLLNSYRYTSSLINTFTSCNAKLKPIHPRGPAANGIYAHRGRFFTSSVSHLSGSNRSGLFQYFGLIWIARIAGI